MLKEDYMAEKTLVLVKPDGVQRAIIGRIITTFEDAGMKVVALKMVHPAKELVSRHYAADNEWMESVGRKTIASFKAKGAEMGESPLQIGERIRGWLLEYLTEAPVVAMVVEGNEAISMVRKFAGATSPASADPSTIRGRYSTDSYQNADPKGRPVRNIIHASEDKKSADREIAIWFKHNEIMDYKRADEASLG